ncbi:MAG: hypothetical protein LBO20_05385 [Bifidobacteriaceae bacterium]|nr:hypothetical protein [Bifidobacteriaceae bacterium]
MIDQTLDEALSGLPALALEGAKGVGKTATASRRAATILSLNDPRARASVAANYDLVAELPPPVFVDEWQLVPEVWDRVRQAVDQSPSGRLRQDPWRRHPRPIRQARLADRVVLHTGPWPTAALTASPWSRWRCSAAEAGAALRPGSVGGLAPGRTSAD